ncbi:MAG: hypothetical protein ACE5K4_12060 [Candidatus Hydrothermarchaeota archaeon]
MVKYIFDPESPIVVLTSTLEGTYGVKKKVDMALDTAATYDFKKGILEIY